MPGMENLAPDRTDTSSGSLGVADPLAHLLLQTGAGPVDLGGEPVGPATLHVVAARGGPDGEARRDRESQHRRHLGQVGTLAAEEVLHLHRGLAVGVVEVEDERHQEGSPRWIRGRVCTTHGLRVDPQAYPCTISVAADTGPSSVRGPVGARGPGTPGRGDRSGRGQAASIRWRSSATSPSTGTRTCSVVSRSRTVTAPSSSESKSTVTHHGVPTSSWRR